MCAGLGKLIIEYFLKRWTKVEFILNLQWSIYKILNEIERGLLTSWLLSLHQQRNQRMLAHRRGFGQWLRQWLTPVTVNQFNVFFPIGSIGWGLRPVRRRVWAATSHWFARFACSSCLLWSNKLQFLYTTRAKTTEFALLRIETHLTDFDSIEDTAGLAFNKDLQGNFSLMTIYYSYLKLL